MNDDDQLLWQEYAVVYDTLMSEIIPYQNLLMTIVRGLPFMADSRVLDVGCGTGNLITTLERENIHCPVTGIDYSAAMLERAAVKGDAYGPAVFYQADLNHPPATWGVGGSFDIIVSNNCMYALDDPHRVLQHLADLAVPGARLAISTPRVDPDTQAVLAEHLRQAGRPDELDRLQPFLTPMIDCNRRILEHYGVRGGHFPDEAQLRQWLNQSGWCLTDLSITYAGQNWLAFATRELS